MNQLYNDQKKPKLVLFSTQKSWLDSIKLNTLDWEGRREEDADELVVVVAEDADLGEAEQEVEAASHGAVTAEGASRVHIKGIRLKEID